MVKKTAEEKAKTKVNAVLKQLTFMEQMGVIANVLSGMGMPYLGSTIRETAHNLDRGR